MTTSEYVYVVMGSWDYVGDDLVGVYSSIEKAHLESARVEGDDEYCYDKVFVVQMEVE